MASLTNSNSDIEEKQLQHPKTESAGGVPMIYEDGAVPGESFEVGNSLRAKMMRFAGKLKIEQRGIARVPEDERTESGIRGLLNVSTMVSAPEVNI